MSLYDLPDPSDRVETRWEVFLSTSREFIAGYTPTVATIVVPIAGAVGVFNNGFNSTAIFDAIVLSLILIIGNIFLLICIAADIAYRLYRKNRGNR